MLRYRLTAAIAITAAVTSACGGAGSGQRRTAHPPATARPVRSALGPAPSLAPGRLLIFFKRTVGGDPEASQLTVDRDGRASAYITLGGPDGQKRHDFRITGEALRRLTRLVRRTPLHDTACCDVRYYIYFISARGHSWRVEQHAVPARSRALLRELDAITDAHTGYLARTS